MSASEKKMPQPDLVKYRFDELLDGHLRRLTQTNWAIGSQSLDMITMSVVVLMHERELEIEDSLSEEAERYTQYALRKELNDIIADFGDIPLDATLETFIQDGCIQKEENQYLTISEPIRNTAKMLSDVFPQMPGMSLVAYLYQTIGEVLAGRKDLYTGEKQLEQLLFIHGEGVVKDLEESIPASRPKFTPSVKLDRSQAKKLLHDYAYQKPDKRSALNVPVGPGSASKRDSTAVESREFTFKDLSDKPANEDSGLETDEQGQTTETMPGPSEESAATPGQENKENENELTPEISRDEAENIESPSLHNPVPDIAAPPEPALDILDVKGIETEDDFIENKIAALEERLGLSCPLCEKGTIHVNSTKKGKLFYLCASVGCDFISWGKPYYTPCPDCHNAYLVEVNDNNQEIILKCPRVTCHYKRSLDEDPQENRNHDSPFDRKGQGRPEPEVPHKKVRKVLIRRKKK